MWVIHAIGIAVAVLWLAGTVVMVWWRLAHLINKEEKISMAYHKVGSGTDEDGVEFEKYEFRSDEEAKQALLDSLPDADECGIPEDDDEAASDEARALMRQVNGVAEHAKEIERILKSVPPSSARLIAEQKIKETVMWAGQAFIDSEA